MKIYKIRIATQLESKTFYTESDNEFGNPMYDNGELMATGYKTFLVSESLDMTNMFSIIVAPDKCSLIEIEEVVDKD